MSGAWTSAASLRRWALVVFVATHYVRTIPTGGSDMALALALTLVGLSLGVLCGYATHVLVDADGTRVARVGPVAAILLLAGISARLVFVFALEHEAGPVIRDFGIVHHISAATWPLALVSMARCEVTAGLVILQVRGQQLAPRTPATVSVSSFHA